MERNRRKQLTVVIKAVVLLSLLGTLLIHQWITINDSRRYEVEPFFINYTQYGCVVPYLDPFDPSITQYINTPQPLMCHGTQYELTYLDSEGWLKLNSTEIASSRLNLNCFYRCYDRTEGDDITINYSDWKLIADKLQPGCEFLETYCARASFPHLSVYSNNHNQIIPNVKSPKDNRKPSVILIVLDSVSNSNFIRNMPKSLKVLKLIYGSLIFKGMNKIGDNSFANAVGFLSGKVHNDDFGDVKGFFDDHPLIWKDFKRNNYTTFYAEDYPSFNLFYYLAKGFRNKPVDHYFRPFWLNVYWSYLHRKSKHLCYGNEAMHNLQLHYLSQFIQKYEGIPKFALNWLTELGHDYLNQVNVGDEDLANFLTEHYQSLKDSFFFVLSDHGHRFNSIRQTPIGRLEEQLPFFSMHIPDFLLQKYPIWKRVLQQNTEVLTTFWDFYITLRDILFLVKEQSWHELNDANTVTFSHIERFRSYSKRGTSLLRPIENRNCVQANIPEEYCICHKETEINTGEAVVKICADALISHINDKLILFPQCSKLKLLTINHAYSILPTSQHSLIAIYYRVSLEAAPSGAIFESLLKYHKSEKSATVVGDTNRINKYGNLSTCVSIQELRKFCYCDS